MSTRARIIQICIIILVNTVTLFLLTAILPGFHIDSPLQGLFVAAALILAQVLYWWVFVSFFTWLPAWLYPVFTFLISGITVLFVGNLVPGITIEGWSTGLWISLALTAVNAILSEFLSLDLDERFDRNVTQRLVKKRGEVNLTTIPGILFLEIDGLGEKIFRHALEEGIMPNLKRMFDKGTHTVLGWETDFTSQTGAMQTGILMGSNKEVPAYRWWDRQEHRLVMSGNPRDAKSIETRLSSGQGLLSGGGASRGNMYSGDAKESLLTFSTLLDPAQKRGPGFYLYLLNPYVIARLVTRFLAEVIREWWQAWQQRRRKDKYIIKRRNFSYAFFRAFIGPLLQDLVTYTVINDALRGVPAVYALYGGYDDVAHFTGMNSPESMEMLHAIDAYFGRIEKALKYAPRPYHVVILSDHGQSIGPTFENASGKSLEGLVKDLISGGDGVYASINTNEAWDNVNAFLSESVNADSRAADVLGSMMKSKTRDGAVSYGPDRSPTEAQQENAQAANANVIVLASGCAGLINFTKANERMTYEQIQEQHPNLILGLASHPGIGFILVHSEKDGDLVLGKGGIHFLDDDTVEGRDPLGDYGTNAAKLLKRESSFSNCPDLVVNTRYDPQTDELAGFETQVSHHGGMGGPQNHAFIFYPTRLPWDGTPVVGAENVYRLLKGWRDTVQFENDNHTSASQ